MKTRKLQLVTTALCLTCLIALGITISNAYADFDESGYISANDTCVASCPDPNDLLNCPAECRICATCSDPDTQANHCSEVQCSDWSRINSGQYKIDGNTILRITESNDDTIGKRVVGHGEGLLAIGHDVAPGNKGSNNLIIGHKAGFEHTRGGTNTIIGHLAGSGCQDDAGGVLVCTPRENRGNLDNVVIGYSAGALIEDSEKSIFIGAYANDKGKGSDWNTMVGYKAGETNEGIGNTVLGTEAGRFVTSGSNNVLLGLDAGNGAHYTGLGVPIGSGHSNTHIGTNTSVGSENLTSTIAIGDSAYADSSNQMVVGSDRVILCYTTDEPAEGCMSYSHCPAIGEKPFGGQHSITSVISCDPLNISDVHWGAGISSDNPQDVAFHSTAGSGENTHGANFFISAGESTGNANGGDIVFQTSSAGPAGSGQNALQDRMVITADGNAGIGTSVPGYRLTVQGGVSDGLAVLNQNGAPVSLFDANAGEAGRFRLYDYYSSQTPLINIVAGGVGYFEGTSVDFRDNSGNSMLKLDADAGYARLALTSGSPPATDCDESSERGRMKVDNAAGSLYICVDSGWVAK